MANYIQGAFKPQHPTKYIGKHTPRYRSGWELAFMRMCDNHPNILAWASEAHRIPYINPVTGKKTSYVPDFFMIYADKNGKKHAEIIEVKPNSQVMGNARSTHDKMHAVVNEAKWKMARQWAYQQGMGFRVITENEMFNKPSQKPKRRRKR